MLIYYGLLHAFVLVFGDGQFALRVPSALVGAGLTPVVFLLGRRMFGTRSAVIAAAIVAVSPALVVWNQQARGYGFGTLLIALSLLAFFRATESPNRLWWTVYGFLVLLSIYTIAYAAMFLVGAVVSASRSGPGRSVRQSRFWRLSASRPWLMCRSRPHAAIWRRRRTAHQSGSLHERRHPPARGAHLGSCAGLFCRHAGLGDCHGCRPAELDWGRRRAGVPEYEARPASTKRRTSEWRCHGCSSRCFRSGLLARLISSIFNSSFLLQSVPAGALIVAFVFGNLLPRGLSYVFAIGFIVTAFGRARSDLRCFFRAVGTSLPLHPHRLPSG